MGGGGLYRPLLNTMLLHWVLAQQSTPMKTSLYLYSSGICTSKQHYYTLVPFPSIFTRSLPAIEPHCPNILSKEMKVILVASPIKRFCTASKINKFLFKSILSILNLPVGISLDEMRIQSTIFCISIGHN